ncbi:MULTISPECIES: hypothetical protein [Pseudanabaena]|jgi:hypothetical protein|uniref:hypothetical protein n=1 Tax=Pseudanabaena TaxID=1152 RepID=UPI0024795851|nr:MULTISPECIES: hypothetical protein [Pseudanabaena]MEA5490256.1 hypothetical protein [Pseudanabaena sp. CCNP1317]WGS71156.1 hypothetical protein OA858_15690 [Pseudanabaena galeata CCNP1313]
MYNLTNDQKELAKWLVQNVKDGNLDKEFTIFWFNGLDGLEIKIESSNYRGNPNLDKVKLAQGNFKDLSSEGLISFEETAAAPYLTRVCHLKGNIYSAVENDFKNPDLPKSPRHKQNPWMSGSFYLFALVVVSVAFAVISAYIPWYIIPILLIAAIIALGVIGAFQLRMDGELNESNFLTLMIETYKRLPLLIQDKTKPPSKK